jgi:pullulanase
MLRSKPLGDDTYDHNSYKSPDSVNSLKWDDLNQELYQDTYRYYQGLIAFRKAHPALRMTDAELVKSSVTAITNPNNSVLAFNIAGGVNGEDSEGLYVIFNPRPETMSLDLPEGKWTIYINGEDAGTTPLGTAEGSVSVDPISAMVLVKESASQPSADKNAPQQPVEENVPINPIISRIIVGVLLAGIAIAVIMILKKNRK